MKKDIWVSNEWRNNPEICLHRRRTGLRLKIDKSVDPEVKEAFLMLAKWIRERFFFFFRLPAYIKSSKMLKAKDGDLCVGIFFEPDSYADEPYIRVSTGDYMELVNKKGTLQARIAILLPFLHELTHYYQWINSENLTQIGKERQATRYSQDIMDEYLDDLGLLDKL